METADAAARAAAEIGFPVVLKLCGDAIAHKTERGLVRLSLGDEGSVRAAGEELLALARRRTARCRCWSPRWCAAAAS